MKPFIKNILTSEFGDNYEEIFNQSPLIRYLDSKMGAIYGDSKTRRSLANIYAIYSITSLYANEFCNDNDKYKKFSGYQYTKLFQFCRTLCGGDKLQNHSFNNRVNSEFQNKTNETNPLIITNEGKYFIHIDYLYVNGTDISKTINNIVSEYISLLQEKDNLLNKTLSELKTEKNIDKKLTKLSSMIDEEAEARIFEIVSYSILKNHYKNTTIYWGYTKDNLQSEQLTLYKTGRTNANDGGIDFVMKPLGRFFQVTEVNNYDKYLLDMDKVIHFPITFVIKTHKTKDEIIVELKSYIETKSGGMEVIKKRYNNAIEDIITINELKVLVKKLDSKDIDTVITDIELYYNHEMNLL